MQLPGFIMEDGERKVVSVRSHADGEEQDFYLAVKPGGMVVCIAVPTSTTLQPGGDRDTQYEARDAPSDRFEADAAPAPEEETAKTKAGRRTTSSTT